MSHSAWLWGAERSVLTAARHLDRERFELQVVLMEDGPLRGKLEALGVRTYLVPMQRWVVDYQPNGRKRLLRVARTEGPAVETLSSIIRREHIDLVHTNTVVNIAGALAAFRCRVPHVWHIREVLGRDSAFSFPKGNALALWMIALLSTRILACSADVLRQFPWLLRRVKGVVAHDAVEVERLAHPPEGASVLRSQLAPGSGELLVGIVGSIIPSKGHLELVRALAIARRALPTLKLVVIGLEYGEYAHQVCAQIKAENLEPWVTFAGFMEDVAPAIHCLDLLVSPSWREPFGMAIVEAMAAGKPVVATNRGGPAESVLDGETGLLVPPHDPAALAEAMVAILKDPNRRRRMGELGRIRAREHFTAHNYVPIIEGVYRAALRLPPEAPHLVHPGQDLGA